MDEFTDKVVLITGAGRGKGREIALGFASLGAVVAANDINPLNLDETVNQIRQAGGRSDAFVFDIAKRMPIAGMLAQVLEQFGKVNILVNHASVKPDASLLEMDEWDFHRTIDVNLAGVFFTMQQVGRVMQVQGEGSMVNLLSFGGHGHYTKGQAAYIASQAGVIGLTHAAARELADHHIRVNAVYQGESLETEDFCTVSRMPNLGAWREAHPQVRLGHHPELVSAVLYLCSSEAASLNGKIVGIESKS